LFYYVRLSDILKTSECATSYRRPADGAIMVAMDETSSRSLSKVAIFGLGYVGSVTGACLASIGNRVIGIDSDEHKVQCLNAGEAPFFEPGLEEIIRNCAANGRLSATLRIEEALAEADVALICVGTPSERNGNLGLDQMRRVCQGIAEVSSSRSKPLVVAIRSTVFPGTCDEVVIPAFAECPQITVVSNPEFLREGSAVDDFLYPSLLVVGGHDADAVRKVAALYSPLETEPCLVSLRTAEMIKYACNTFHAVKIAFANEIGALSAQLGVDGQEVMATLCQDVKLNASKAYLRPGFAFGGSCLPKDLRALTYRANRLDVKTPLIDAALPSNREHLNRAIRAVMDSGAKKIGVVGLTFKENTDDLRESPVLAMVEHLLGKGVDLRIFDPHVNLETIYGSNRNFLLNAIPHISRLLEPRLETLLAWADQLVLTQKPTADGTNQILRCGLPVIDLACTGLAQAGQPVSA
jgi:GDP-mannose 6-dehydrogenase